jgi:thioesterase domain-containing protein/acyl carrier protein
MASLWAELLERDEGTIGVDDDFFDLGGHSLLAIELILRVEQMFGTHVPLRQLFEAPTLRDFVAALDGGDGEPSRASGAVCLSTGDVDRTPVYCVAGLGSTILGWRRAAALLDPRIPVYGLEAAAIGTKERPLQRIDELADRHLEVLAETIGDGPVVLCGHSFGGLVAYEMARRLAAQGQPVAGLVLLDTRAGRKAARHTVTPSRLPRMVRSALRRRAISLRRAIELRARDRGLIKATSSSDRWRWTIESHRAAIEAWTPEPYDGSILLLAVESWRLELDDTLGWAPLVRSVEVVPIPGVHQHLLEPEWVTSTAAALDTCLLRLTERSTAPSPADSRQ